MGEAVVGLACPPARLIVTVGCCVSILKAPVKSTSIWVLPSASSCPGHGHLDVREGRVRVGDVVAGHVRRAVAPALAALSKLNVPAGFCVGKEIVGAVAVFIASLKVTVSAKPDVPRWRP